MSPRISLYLIIILTVLALWIDLPRINFDFTLPIVGIRVNSANLVSNFPLKLGLDLQGGTQLTFQADLSKVDVASREDAMKSLQGVMERRVNLFGVSEALVQSSKVGSERRIIVELPGVSDASAAANLVGRVAELDFREIDASKAAELAKSEASVSAELLYSSTGLSGGDLKNAKVSFANGKPEVQLGFSSDGARKFGEITGRNVGKPIAIYLDEELLTAPVVQQEIVGGNAVINGSFSVDEAKLLAVQLNAGALPVPVKLIAHQRISATLGEESIHKSLIACLVGVVTVIVFMVYYYGFWGLVADLALTIYMLLVIAIFKTGAFILPPVTLTLAGIAGFVLSVGMAVDANILIFERMKEERRWGKSKEKALDLGFTRAWSSIRDSNVSSLITASILYFLGSGAVRGFAITLAIGVLVSMFTAITVTRTILRLAIK